MAKGDIVLLTFPFTNLRSSKLRPAVILIETSLDITVCFITSQIKWHEDNDLIVTPSLINGLKKQSLVRTAKNVTIDKSLAQGLLGRLSSAEITELNNKLKILFKLD